MSNIQASLSKAKKEIESVGITDNIRLDENDQSVTIIDQVKLQLSRTPRPLPTMRLNPEVKDIFGFKFEDFILENYDPWPTIKGEVSI